MSDADKLLNRAFPPEQCLSECQMALAEEAFDQPLTELFYPAPVLDRQLVAPVHMQNPFTTTVEEWAAVGAEFKRFHRTDTWHKLFVYLNG